MFESRSHRYPLYRVWDGDDEYGYLNRFKGGWRSQPDDPCVTVYVHGPRRLVLKTVTIDDGTGEVEAVARVAPLGLIDCLVPAVVAQLAETPGPGPTGAANYSVVVMRYCGDALTFYEAASEPQALLAALYVCRICRRLFERGFAYTDLKPDNVLCSDETKRLLLCDYGSVSLVGQSNAVCTYPPPEWPAGQGVEASERTVIYGVGVLLASLLDASCLQSLAYVNVADPASQANATLELRAANERIIEAQTSHAAREVLHLAWLGAPSLRELESCITRHVT